MKISKIGATPQQVAYARRVWGGDAQSKRQVALDVGYSPSVANSCVSKIESRRGFNNAMARLAADSGNLALSVMHELKGRGFKDFSNKDLISSVNAIAGAWNVFNKGLIQSETPQGDNGKNKLRTIVLNRINHQTVNNALPTPEPIEAEFKEGVEEVDINMDF